MLLYIIVFLTSIAMFAILHFANFPLDYSAKYYILSSISQGLAALLAFVFTAIFIIVQVFRRFRAWKIAVSAQNITVIICYCVGIILPLIFLRIGIEPFMVNLSISLTFACVFILIPFIRGFGEVMVGPIVLGELEENIIDAVNKKARGRVIGYVSDFTDIWVSKIRKKKCSSLDEIWNTWLNINTRIRSLKNYKIELDVITSICKALVEISSRKNMQYFSNYASKVFESFHPRFNYSPPVPKSLYDYYIQKSTDILRIAIRKKLIDVSRHIVERLLYSAWDYWFKAGPIDDRDKDTREIIKQMMAIDKTFVRNTLTNNQMIAVFEGDGRNKQRRLIEIMDAIENPSEPQNA